MIKALFLIFSPVATWAKIALDKDGFYRVLFLFLTPLILISVGVEVGTHVYFHEKQTDPTVPVFPVANAWPYAITEVALDFVVVFLAAQCVTMVAKTFHQRHKFFQGFTVAAYAFGPYFLVRMLDAIPGMNGWANLGIFFAAIALTLGTLYSGIPPVMEPDPPSAFGIYFMSAFLFFGVAGLARLICYIVLMGKLRAF
jgi:hypothetical protein